MSAPSLPMEVTANAGNPLGMPAAEFLRDYWQKRPLLIRNAMPAVGTEAGLPIEANDLAGLACEDFALSRLIIHHADSDSWQVEHGPLSEDRFDDLPERDWTLLVQDVDRWDADVAGLLAHFDFLPRWRIDDIMVSFAAPGGSVGAHVDQYDVFLIQALGTRRWQIDAGPNPDLSLRDDVDIKLLRHFNPDNDWQLQPGDMLYLPPGVPHHGVAMEPCLTFSVGMRAPSKAEMLTDLAEQLAESVPESQRYADPDLAPPVDPSEIDSAAIRRARDAVPEFAALDDDQFIHWWGCFITRYRSAGNVAPAPNMPDTQDLQRQLRAGAVLHRHPLTRLAWSRQGTESQLFVNGVALPCEPSVATMVCGHSQLHAAQIDAIADSALETIRTLLAEGHLMLIDSTHQDEEDFP